MRRRSTVPLLLAAVVAAAGCATTSSSAGSRPAAADAGPGTPAAELRLGYFPNVTHATALYGVASGTFERALGQTRLSSQTFNAGPAVVEALFAGAVDAAYLGPSPTINAFLRSRGAAVRIVAGATSGGASLVVRPEITDVSQLRGTSIGTPQTGNTQDVALRHFLAESGYEVDRRGAGDVTVVAQENAQSLATFQSGQIDGAWLPEPWASRLVLEAGGKVLVDEKDLWPGGRFVTTHLVVRTEFLEKHPQTVQALVEGSVAANEQIDADEAKAKQVINAALEELAGKALPTAILDRAFSELDVTDDPGASSLKTSAEHAFATGLVEEADLTGIYDLTLLRTVLGAEVDDAGLGAS